MTAVDNTPSNRNFLSPLNFSFQIKRAPNVNFFLQKVNIPSITIPKIDIPTPFVPIPSPFTHLTYGEFSITFKVDEDFQNYLEIHNWIRSLGFPDNPGEYLAIEQNPEYTGAGLTSDISLIALNSAKNPNYEITFRNAFPTRLSDVNFDATLSDVQFVTAEAQFTYFMYDISRVY